MLLDVKAFAFATCRLILLLLELGLELCDLRSEQTGVILSGLILLSPGVLLLKLFDLVSNTHI